MPTLRECLSREKHLYFPAQQSDTPGGGEVPNRNYVQAEISGSPGDISFTDRPNPIEMQVQAVATGPAGQLLVLDGFAFARE